MGWCDDGVEDVEDVEDVEEVEDVEDEDDGRCYSDSWIMRARLACYQLTASAGRGRLITSE